MISMLAVYASYLNETDGDKSVKPLRNRRNSNANLNGLLKSNVRLKAVRLKLLNLLVPLKTNDRIFSTVPVVLRPRMHPENLIPGVTRFNPPSRRDRGYVILPKNRPVVARRSKASTLLVTSMTARSASHQNWSSGQVLLSPRTSACLAPPSHLRSPNQPLVMAWAVRLPPRSTAWDGNPCRMLPGPWIRNDGCPTTAVCV